MQGNQVLCSRCYMYVEVIPDPQGSLLWIQQEVYLKGMSQTYWDERQRRKLVTGWSAEGMLAL